jgi:DNA-binding transcriptional MerR regulator
LTARTGTGSTSAIRWPKPRLVHLLRSLDLPLDQVRAAVTAWKAGDAAAVSEVIRRHRCHPDAWLTRLRGALHRIDHLLSEG